MRQRFKEFVVYIQWRLNYAPRRGFETKRFDRFFNGESPGYCQSCGMPIVFNIPECMNKYHPRWGIQYMYMKKKEPLWVWMFFNGIHEPEIIKYYPKKA